jgi:hypothetical protein
LYNQKQLATWDLEAPVQYYDATGDVNITATIQRETRELRDRVERDIAQRVQNESVTWLLERYMVERQEKLLKDIARWRFTYSEDDDIGTLHERMLDAREAVAFILIHRQEQPRLAQYVQDKLFRRQAPRKYIQALEQAIEWQRQRWTAVGMASHGRLGDRAGLGSLNAELVRSIMEGRL